MAFETGLAANYDDLLNKVITFVTTDASLIALNQQWQLLNDEIIPEYAINGGPGVAQIDGTFRTVYLKAPGLANQDNIYINILQWSYAISQQYNWRLFGAIDYDPLFNIEYQPGTQWNGVLNSTTYPTFAILANSQMEYWMVANGRRLMIAIKIEGDFYFIHLGYFLPYGLPSEYPVPMLISGQENSSASNPSSTVLHNLWSPLAANDSRSMVKTATGQWGYLGTSTTAAIPTGASIWPWPNFATGSLVAYRKAVGNPDGSFTTMPAMIYSSQPGFEGVYGEIQGLVYVPKAGEIDLNSQDTLTIGGKTYLVMQNVDKNGAYDYAAMLLE